MAWKKFTYGGRVSGGEPGKKAGSDGKPAWQSAAEKRLIEKTKAIAEASRAGGNLERAAEFEARLSEMTQKFSRSSDSRGKDPATQVRVDFDMEGHAAQVRGMQATKQAQAEIDTADMNAHAEKVRAGERARAAQAEMDFMSSVAANGRPVGDVGTKSAGPINDLSNFSMGDGPGSAAFNDKNDTPAQAVARKKLRERSSGGGGDQPRVPPGSPEGGQFAPKS